jgi:hypothetical protein
VETARARFVEGVRLYKLGDDLGARLAFLDAERAHHAAVTIYNLALVEERLGHAQAAVDDYERYVGEAGEQGEFTQSAVVASAELRRRASKVRIETQPAGARLFIDGAAIEERSPLTWLLLPGKHHVSVEWDHGRADEDVDVQGGTPRTLSFSRPAEPAPTSTLPARVPPESQLAPAEVKPPPAPPRPPEIAGLVFGGAFIAMPYHFQRLNSGKNDDGAFAGLSGEIGYAFAEHAFVGLRVLAAAGSSCRQVLGAHVLTAGPALEYHVSHSFWIGASLNGGQGEACRDGATLSTDIVFSPMLDASYAVTSQDYGQWLVSLGFGYFFANPTNDTGLFYAPIGFGPRFY